LRPGLVRIGRIVIDGISKRTKDAIVVFFQFFGIIIDVAIIAFINTAITKNYRKFRVGSSIFIVFRKRFGFLVSFQENLSFLDDFLELRCKPG